MILYLICGGLALAVLLLARSLRRLHGRLALLEQARRPSPAPAPNPPGDTEGVASEPEDAPGRSSVDDEPREARTTSRGW